MSEQAIKIFEALSDVDQELLERCDQKTVGKSGAAYRLFRRYGKAMAAGICLVVVGAASWGGYQLITAGSRSDSAGATQLPEAAPAEQFNMASSVVVEYRDANDGNGEGGTVDKAVGNGTAYDAGMAGNGAEEAEGASAEGWKPGMDGVQTESDLAAAAVTEASPEAAKQQTVQDTQELKSALNSSASQDGHDSNAGSNADRYAELREQENRVLDSREEIPWEKACAVEPFSDYLPTVFPAGYEAFSARRSSFPEQWDNMIFKWTDGRNILFLNMTLGGVVTREEIALRDGLHEYVAEDFTKELMPDPPVGEPLAFTLYYADGMRIDFSGYITADEMWEVVESISQ